MYVLVTAYDDDSVQILDITPPVGSPTTPHIASTITDGVDGFDRLDGPNFVTTVTIDSSHYALVTSSSNIGSVQIIDITDPYNPIAASSFAHNVPPFISTTLGSPNSIVAIHMGSSTYALISASRGVQVVDITDPYNPIQASSINDGEGGYTALLNTANIHTTTIDSSIYGLVTSESDSAVQLVRFDPPPIVESNNPNPGYATAGDRLSFVFSVNDPIESSMIQFITPDQTPTVSTTGVVYDTRLTVSSDPVEGYAKFVATLENNGGVNLFVTEDDFSESIFVDTIGVWSGVMNWIILDSIGSFTENTNESLSPAVAYPGFGLLLSTIGGGFLQVEQQSQTQTLPNHRLMSRWMVVWILAVLSSSAV